MGFCNQISFLMNLFQLLLCNNTEIQVLLLYFLTGVRYSALHVDRQVANKEEREIAEAISQIKLL